MTKELTKQVGSLEDFQNMNVLQQQALADAVGLSVGEVTNMLENQSKLNDLTSAGLEHYKKTGEIMEQQPGLWKRLTMGAAAHTGEIFSGISALGSLGQLKIIDRAKSLAFWVKEKAHLIWRKAFGGAGPAAAGPLTKSGKPDMRFKANQDLTKKLKAPKISKVVPSKASDAAAKTSGKGSTGFMKGLGKIDMKKVLMGAAAMVVVAAAVWVFGKAVQEFMKVSWETVAMAVVSMLALVGAVALLGAIMMSGVGAVAILAGAAAMLIVAAAIWVLGKALQEMAVAFQMMGAMSEQLLGLVMLAPALIGLAGVFTLLGLSFLPMAFGLMAITPFLPTLMALSAMGEGLGTVAGALGFGGGGEKEAKGTAATEETNTALIAKIDELITVVKQGGVVNLDGRKVGEIMYLGRIPAGA